ncbi:unnamed protein product, partial [Echinostoma caproni]|uniref:Ig-like domain-containing protein n=1 Tax=Echinostoma caproni TaxID=27848 RepID=A0A183AHH4_9TREM
MIPFSQEPYTIARTRLIRISVRLKPFIYKQFTKTDMPELTDLFRIQVPNSVNSSVQFHKMGLPGKRLEGLLSTKFLIYLGSPRGLVKLILFYELGTPEWVECGLKTMQNLTDSNVPSEIQDSSVWFDSRGENFVKFQTTCHLLPNQLAMLLIIANTFDPKANIEKIHTALVMNFSKTVIQWELRTNHTEQVQLHSSIYGYVTFQLVRVRIGWRATIRPTDPIILFGGANMATQKLPTCYYAIELNSNKPQLISLERSEFFLYPRPQNGSYELIKPRVRPQDSGYYWCQLESCRECRLQERGAPRRLIVLPTSLTVTVLILDNYVDTDQLRKANSPLSGQVNSTLIVYTEQSYFAFCELLITKGTIMPVQMNLSYTYGTADKSVIQSLSYEFRNRRSLEYPNYTTVLDTYQFMTPEVKIAKHILEMRCELQLAASIPVEDVNENLEQAVLTNHKKLKLRQFHPPQIKWTTFYTDRTELTELIRLNLTDSPNVTSFNE